MKQFDPTVITHNLQPILSGLAYTIGTWTAFSLAWPSAS
jgi:polar amino acid transport system permease protein